MSKFTSIIIKTFENLIKLNDIEPQGFNMSNKNFSNLSLIDQPRKPMTRMCQDSNTKF